MNEMTVKPCGCCGGKIKKRRTESATDYRARRTCSRSCGQRLRRGIVTKNVDTTPSAANARIGLALQGWRIKPSSTDHSLPGA
ncbi:MAG: hypothetical protein ABIG70_03140 [Pseudomonadota bacterium]